MKRVAFGRGCVPQVAVQGLPRRGGGDAEVGSWPWLCQAGGRSRPPPPWWGRCHCAVGAMPLCNAFTGRRVVTHGSFPVPLSRVSI